LIIDNFGIKIFFGKLSTVFPHTLGLILIFNKITTLCWSTAGLEIPAKLGAFTESKPEFVKKGRVGNPPLPKVG
jgi:hypothetical protein